MLCTARGIVLVAIYSTSRALGGNGWCRPANASRSWMLYNNELVGGNNFGMCGVRGKIFHQLEVVFNALVLCLRATETLMYSFIPVENRARLIVFPPEPATT